MVELRYLVDNLWLGSSSDACRNIAHLRKGIMFDDVKGYAMLMLKLLPARHAERPRAGLSILGCLCSS